MALWRRITASWELDHDELAVLEQACRTADELALLNAALADAETVTVGSTGQPVVNKLFGEVRAHRLALQRLLSHIRVPAGSTSTVSEAARAAAKARWDRHGA